MNYNCHFPQCTNRIVITSKEFCHIHFSNENYRHYANAHTCGSGLCKATNATNKVGALLYCDSCFELENKHAQHSIRERDKFFKEMGVDLSVVKHSKVIAEFLRLYCIYKSDKPKKWLCFASMNDPIYKWVYDNSPTHERLEAMIMHGKKIAAKEKDALLDILEKARGEK